MSIRQSVGNFLPPRLRGRWIELEQRTLQAIRSIGAISYLEPLFIKPYLVRPYAVDIEVTSNCDADCIMCPRKAMSRRVGPMDFSLFKKIIDEAVALDVQELRLNGYGEISILRNYKEYLSYIRQKSRSIKIIINTNGMRMSAEMAKVYVESRVQTVNIAIDGATAETFENIRKKLKLDVVENNVRQLIQIRDDMGKKHPLVLVQMIAMPQNVHEVDLFFQKWKGVADRVAIAGLLARTEAVSFAKNEDREWEKTPCFLLWHQMPILSDGTVALCCDDWDGRVPQGNLNTSTIKEIWSSQKRQRIRSVHLLGKASKIPLCDGCKQPRQGPIWFGKRQAL